MVDPCRLTSVEQTADALVLNGRVAVELENPSCR